MKYKVGDWVLYIVNQHGKDYIFDIGYIEEIVAKSRLVIYFYAQKARTKKEYVPNSWSLDQFSDQIKLLKDYPQQKKVIKFIFNDML